MAMQRYFDVVQNRQGTAVVGATVTVYDSNGNLATLYSNNSNAATSNPVYTNADGEYAFYAANGTYTIQIAATGYAGETKPGVVLFDPLDAGIVSVKDFGARGDGVTDDTAAIQAAIDSVYLSNGGIVKFPTGRYIVSATIEVPQRVTLVGESFGYVNPYLNNFADAKGTILFLKAGSNCNVVLFRCRLVNVFGTLTEQQLNTVNVGATHFGGIKDITVWGNRSATANPPTTTDTNTLGVGIYIQGCRQIFIEDVVVAYCAEQGIYAGSYDYGTGDIPSNNLSLSKVISNFNAGSGFEIYGGDSLLTNLTGGYNGGNGISTNMSGVFSNSVFWNNLTRGVFLGGYTDRSDAAVTGIHSYDNSSDGFLLSGAYAPALTGCVARGNGLNATLPSQDRCNFSVQSNCEKWNLSGCTSFGIDYLGNQSTRYGFFINNTTFAGGLDGCRDFDSANSFFIANTQNIIGHGGVTGLISHPSVDLDGGSVTNAGTLRFASWQIITSVVSQTISVGTNSLIAANVSGGATVTDISYSAALGLPFVIIRNINATAVTFVHDVNKLRLANATDVTLNQNEAVMFVQVTGAIWQQIGGAY